MVTEVVVMVEEVVGVGVGVGVGVEEGVGRGTEVSCLIYQSSILLLWQGELFLIKDVFRRNIKTRLLQFYPPNAVVFFFILLDIYILSGGFLKVLKFWDCKVPIFNNCKYSWDVTKYPMKWGFF